MDFHLIFLFFYSTPEDPNDKKTPTCALFTLVPSPHSRKPWYHLRTAGSPLSFAGGWCGMIAHLCFITNCESLNNLQQETVIQEIWKVTKMWRSHRPLKSIELYINHCIRWQRLNGEQRASDLMMCDDIIALIWQLRMSLPSPQLMSVLARERHWQGRTHSHLLTATFLLLPSLACFKKKHPSPKLGFQTEPRFPGSWLHGGCRRKADAPDTDLRWSKKRQQTSQFQKQLALGKKVIFPPHFPILGCKPSLKHVICALLSSPCASASCVSVSVHRDQETQPLCC